MALSSGIFKRFKKSFVLDEDGLRRVEGVLSKATATYSEPLVISYHVEREDDRFFETLDIAEVLADPNVEKRRINLLSIDVHKKSALDAGNAKDPDQIAWVVFDKDTLPFRTPDVRVRISSPDKTWALMLADELDPQITRFFRTKEFPRWIFFAYVLLIGLLAYRGGIYLGFPKPEALKTASVFAIASTLFMILLWLYTQINDQPVWIRKYLMTEPVFLWGEETTAFQEREVTRKNIFWVVLVGFLVSFVAGIVTLAL